MLKLSIVLTVISCAAALLIAVTNIKTEEKIAGQQRSEQQKALRHIMPKGVQITENRILPPSETDSVTYWTGVSGDDTVFAFKIGNRGYSSIIEFLVCTTADGIITGLIVLEQHETPGLGARGQETLSKKYVWNSLFGAKEQIEPWFSEQFEGISIRKPIHIEKKMGEWHSLNDGNRKKLLDMNGITAITGSTISTHAVTGGIAAKAEKYLMMIRGK